MSAKSPRQSLSKAYLKSPVSRPEIEKFKAAFITMQSKIDPKEDEEYLKNIIRDFLLDSYYKGENQINVKDRKDLVIHNGPKSSDSVGVIIEAKAIKNASEMVTKQDLNKKALQELILYYLRERKDDNNIYLKHLIITNANEWFIFDAAHWERLIYGNKELIKQYEEFAAGGLTDSRTPFFYQKIAKPFIAKIHDQLEYTYFDISKYKTVITNEDKEDDKKLVALFKLLSPTHILKKSFSNDSNSLNRNFYNELLHIIGLEEVSNKGKKVIQRKAEEKREPASLLENTINILKYDTNVVESKHFDTALELCITWINRVLFLKLLESQLITYNKGDDSYRFLDYGKLKNYDALNKLFFQVLAIRPADRRPTVQAEYGKVPYLNSSLFEVSTVEERAIRISGLEDDGKLSIHNATVLKGEKGKRAKGEINTLEYLFRFLEAYNFSSEGGEQIQEENKSLINASVLGLIFEKINGYKDGSFFTPGFITMYMCSETIRRSIMQKFRDQTDYDSEDWGELKNYIGKPYKKEDLQHYNNLIDSIKICDPAVGSGHFLVSALNEMIAIKSELGILCNNEYAKLPVIATVDNDELILENENADHTLYEYDYHSTQSQMVQQAIFHEKKKIIENCLFGVDINPNSVKICRLRLWIELLKNAYYTEESKYTDLETLPNIDINIKCGNSLISRFDLDSDLKPALKKSKFTIDTYKLAVQNYKHATDKESKREFKKLIQTVKSDFKSDIFSKDKIDLQKLEGQFYERFGAATLIDVELTKTQAKKKAAEQKKLVARIDKKKNEIEETQNNKIYENAFEWRFEFPEVLDDEGVYVGFDVVIGNPPYIRQEEFKEIKDYLKSKYETYKGTADLYVYFVERAFQVAANGAQFVYIIPNKWMRAGYGSEMRNYLKDQNLIGIYDFGDLPVFEEATTYPCIIYAAKEQATESFLAADIETLNYLNGLENYLKRSEFEIKINQLSDTGWTLIKPDIQNLLDKIKSKGVTLNKYTEGKVFRGLLTGLNEAFVIDKETKDRLILEDFKSSEILKPFLAGRDIKRFGEPTASKWLILFKSGHTREKYGLLSEEQAWNKLSSDFPAISNWLNGFETKAKKRTDKGDYWWELRPCAYYNEFDKEKIVYPNICRRPEFIVDNNNYINQKCYLIGLNDRGLVSIFNSKMYFFLFMNILPKLRGDFYEPSSKYFTTFPVVEPTDDLRVLCADIIEIKANNKDTDTTHLEAEIDQLVYQLYDLTEEEIQIIEESVGG